MAKRIGWLAAAVAGLWSAVLGAEVTLRPDYANIVVPPNIAPLNFDVLGAEPGCRVRIANGRVAETFSPQVRLGEGFWRELLQAEAYTITV